MAVYMEGTKFELRHFENPDAMHRAMVMMGLGLIWHQEGDPVNDPEHYTEKFDLVDPVHPENNREGMTRAECENVCWNLYCDEYYNN